MIQSRQAQLKRMAEVLIENGYRCADSIPLPLPDPVSENLDERYRLRKRGSGARISDWLEKHAGDPAVKVGDVG